MWKIYKKKTSAMSVLLVSLCDLTTFLNALRDCQSNFEHHSIWRSGHNMTQQDTTHRAFKPSMTRSTSEGDGLRLCVAFVSHL